MNLSVYYIIIAMMFASGTLSIIFFLAWKTLGRKPYALSWSVAFLAAFVQWLLNLYSDQFVSYEVYWLSVNAFAMVVITLGIRGHCQRTECQKLPKNLWPYAGLVYAAVVWTTVIDPHRGINMALVPASACITLLLSARMIINHRNVSRPAEWAAAASLVLFAVSQGIAAGMAVMQGAAGDVAYQSLYVHYNFLTLPSGYMATSMFVIFMIASDVAIEMKEVATHDELTGVLNRRGLGEQGAGLYAAADRSGRSISVIMTDIDRFKGINDEYGHSVGDVALAHFSKLLSENRRTNDLVARLGGEEFCLVLPGAKLKSALAIASELRVQIEQSPLETDGVSIPMTASFGVATLADRDTCLTDVIVKADRALYRSKDAGRNQVDLDSSQLMLASDGTLKSITA